MKRLFMAFKAFWQVLLGKENGWKEVSLPEEIDNAPEKREGSKVDRFGEGSIFTLILLQREGRFIDFVQECIDDFSDEQIGSAVRKIHLDCKKTLDEYFNITSIFDGPEGKNVAVDKGMDPSMVRFNGNLSDSKPEGGVLKHKGWKVTNLDLPKRSEAMNPKVIQPAELEV